MSNLYTVEWSNADTFGVITRNSTGKPVAMLCYQPLKHNWQVKRLSPKDGKVTSWTIANTRETAVEYGKTGNFPH